MMAKPGLAQEQTVEEILASIRQVISADQKRRATSAGQAVNGTTPASRAIPRASTLTGTKPEREETSRANAGKDGTATDRSLSHASGDHADVHNAIELAIEQALDSVNSEDGETHAGTPPARAEMSRPEAEKRAAAGAPEAPPSRPPPLPSRSLLSPRANAAVAASFDDLAKVLSARGARGIDQTVEELLRPMLKSWLEDNLPPLVERLVREEIERVSRGRR